VPDLALDLPDAASGVSWGISVRAAETGDVVIARDAERVHRTASVGKLLLLAEIARGLGAGEYAGDEPLSRASVAPVADSGLWRHLHVETLPLHDVAALIGSVSDNLATNVAVHRVGLDAVRHLGAALGVGDLALHDIVRDVRGPDDPATLSTARAAELSAFFSRLHQADVVDATTSAQVLRWLAPGTDLSMAAAAFGLDPLAHDVADRGVRLWNKTGTDAGVRADTGLATGPGGAFAYAFLAEWDGDERRRDGVLDGMRQLGHVLRELVT
jgi:beta-lactamase class A